MPMTVGTGIGTDMHAVPTRARALEELGYDFVAIGETTANPFLPLVLVAEHTTRLNFGTSVAIAFPRVPHISANLAWDLSRYSGGRFVLGLGTQVKGHNERRFSVPWAPPGPRLRDYINCMRAIWDSWQNGTKPDYEGEYYQYKLTSPMFNPGPIEHPDIKVVISAVNPFNARLAGEVADGIAIHGFSTFKYIREVLLPAVHEGARRAGKDLKDLKISGGGFVVTGRTEEDVAVARERSRRQISFYASTRSYSKVMSTHGWDDEAAHLHRLSIEGRWDDMVPIITDDMMEEFCVIGTWDELPGKMREKYAGLNTQVGFGGEPRNPDEVAQIKELIAELKTIPAVGEV
ncbi:MAG: TIGR03617 family F420-dependent LLM class oxidoreductase [Chloroflexi bacterium]|nr:TIGR03617 family F420-dependent LLM class oxidoreductase [Chloroflexota bacterium]MDA1004315.1 TIGR03617 family F420-dependent LLM class oxidoreductase [Chloroflexota bacterium]